MPNNKGKGWSLESGVWRKSKRNPREGPNENQNIGPNGHKGLNYPTKE